MKTGLLHLAVPALMLAALPSYALTHYVDVSSTNPVAPYTSWATAANVIQDAVDAAVGGDTVLVSNGVYNTGGKVVYGAMTNRVAVDKPLSLLSVNGPGVTVIEGYQVPGTINTNGAIRCVYLTNGASLIGFTLTNGATRADGDNAREQSGGGLWCESTNAWASNCVVTGNSAREDGGGSYGGTLNNCTLTGNSAGTFGGGSSAGTLNNCTLMGNSADWGGGGSYDVMLDNCTITGNSAGWDGGGSYDGTLNNCIIYSNTASVSGGNSYQGNLNYCCTTPMPSSGTGNITNAPLFLEANSWADLRLKSNSPCINSGNNAYVTTTNDLDGNPRIVAGLVDMGAYEFQSPQSMLPYAWLQQYGLPTDGSADYADPDSDSHNTWQEWKAWTDPTNELSVLRMLMPDYTPPGLLLRWNSEGGSDYWIERAAGSASLPSFSVLQTSITGQPTETSFRDSSAGLTGSAFYRVGTPAPYVGPPITMQLPEFVPSEVEVTWQSVAGHAYSIERATNPATPYSVLQSNILGQVGTTSYTDTNAIGGGPFFYRVGVSE